jgi:hypothetical protein
MKILPYRYLIQWILTMIVVIHAKGVLSMNVLLESASSSIVNRNLMDTCKDGSQPILHYFEVILTIQPDINVFTDTCTLADKMKMGSDINAILSSHVSTFV